LTIQDETYQSFADELVKIAEGETAFEWEGVNYTMDGNRLEGQRKLGGGT